MIIIGERINSTRKPIYKAIETKDAKFLIDEAKKQANSGADFIDVNCAMFLDKEPQIMKWLVTTIQNEVALPLCIDSPNPKAQETGLSVHKGRAFVNSITAQEERLNTILPLINRYNAFTIGLVIDENGMPKTAQERFDIANAIAKKTKISYDNLYIDALVRPIAAEQNQGYEFIEAIKLIKKNSNLKTTGGLSNVSYGLPNRGLLNSVFLKLAIDAGIDAVIIDPTEKLIKGVLSGESIPREPFDIAKKTLLGEDEYCMEYIKASREGRLNL